MIKLDKHSVDVYVFRDDLKCSLEFTQGTNALPIEFQFKDWDIPAGAEAAVYVEKPSGKGWQEKAKIEGDHVIVDVSAQMVAEAGIANMQLEINDGEKVLLTFNQPLCVQKSALPINSQNGSTFIEEYIKKCNDAVSAADGVKRTIEETARNGGFSATVNVGTTVTGDFGTEATVTNAGTLKDAVFNFVIPSGPKGESGVMAPSAGMFTLFVDYMTGDLYVEYPDGSEPPEFMLENNGDLYFVTHRKDDGTVARILIGNVRLPLADNLTTEESGKYALDAHQGKIIKEALDAIISTLSRTITTGEEI